MASTRAMPSGHVGVVREIVDARTILIDHANWGGREGRAEYGVPVRDVSPANDWSEVRVWYAPIQRLGTRHNPVSGFIYPERADRLASN
jgi:surface antigen